MKPVLCIASAPHSNVPLTPPEIINRCYVNTSANTGICAMATRTMFTHRHMLLRKCKTPYICVLHIVGRSKFKQHIIICVAYFRLSVYRCLYCSSIVRTCAVEGRCETGLHVNAFTLNKLYVVSVGSAILYQGSYAT